MGGVIIFTLRLHKRDVRSSDESRKDNHSLSTVAIVPLDKHDLLGDIDALLDSAEAEDGACPRVCLLVTVGDTHTSAGSDIEASELAVLVDDGDEADVVCEDINIVVWRNSYSDFELHVREYLAGISTTEKIGRAHV